MLKSSRLLAGLLALLLALPLPARATDPYAAARAMAVMWETMLRFFATTAPQGGMLGGPTDWYRWNQPLANPWSGWEGMPLANGWPGGALQPASGWGWGGDSAAPPSVGGPWDSYAEPRGHTGTSLDGRWLSPTGEMLRIENGRFALGDAGGRAIFGMLEARGDTIFAYAPQYGVSQQFRFLQKSDLLVFVDPRGNTIAFRRLTR